MRKIFIIDDQKECLDELKRCLDKRADFEFVYFNSLADFICELDVAREQVCACFFDIELWDKNGIDFSSEIAEKYPSIKIIFITAYNDKYSQAIFLHPSEKMKPFALITKPFDEKVIDSVLNKLCSEKTQYVVSTNRTNTVIPTERITYIENSSRKALIHLDDGTELSEYKKISDIIEKMPLFLVQCHKSYIVNMNKIDSINRSEKVIHIGDEIVLISRNYYNLFIECFLRYKGGIANE